MYQKQMLGTRRSMKLKDKVAIVTGSSQGIGRAIALGLAEAGADLVVNYNQNIEAAKEVAEKIGVQGGRTIVSQGDVSNQYVPIGPSTGRLNR
jgi:NAD(P)-dependent dehydrogenase (short-subunit alcohol dehydrogenase family)